MKNQLRNDTWLYRFVLTLSRQFTPDETVVLGSATAGVSGLSFPFPPNR